MHHHTLDQRRSRVRLPLLLGSGRVVRRREKAGDVCSSQTRGLHAQHTSGFVLLMGFFHALICTTNTIAVPNTVRLLLGLVFLRGLGLDWDHVLCLFVHAVRSTNLPLLLFIDGIVRTTLAPKSVRTRGAFQTFGYGFWCVLVGVLIFFMIPKVSLPCKLHPTGPTHVLRL
jgi:hypothetical protein